MNPISLCLNRCFFRRLLIITLVITFEVPHGGQDLKSQVFYANVRRVMSLTVRGKARSVEYEVAKS